MGDKIAFIDTSAFIALSAKKDKFHADAKNIYSHILKSKTRIITTNLIISETCTWMIYDRTLGHKQAKDFGSFLHLNSSPIFEKEQISSNPSHYKLLIAYSNPLIENQLGIYLTIMKHQDFPLLIV